MNTKAVSFYYSNFDFIWVKEYSNDPLLDSFKIYVYPNLNPSKLNNSRYSIIDRTINQNINIFS